MIVDAEARTMGSAAHPRKVTAHRAAGLLHVEWADGHNSRFSLEWLRANCPCATCRDERQKANSDPLRLFTGMLPSGELVGAEGVGNYAIRLDWADGHNTGIYPYTALRRSCPCVACNPDGAPPILAD